MAQFTEEYKLFYYYFRYVWNEEDFQTLEDALHNYPRSINSSMAGDAAVLLGFDYLADNNLDVDYDAGAALSASGDLCGVAASGTIAVEDDVKSLIVVRPTITDGDDIARPTSPFDTVPLTKTYACEVVAIAGDISNYPSKEANDVILFGVVASGGSITSVDKSKCELFGKNAELKRLRKADHVVGNQKWCTHATLAEALADAVAGDYLRVTESETVNTTISSALDDITIEFDPGVIFSKGSATTGFAFSGDGVKFINGKVSEFSTASDIAIDLTGDFCSIQHTRFVNNDTDIDDTNATSAVVGVINE
jgi:hypothetical protein